MTLIIHPQDKSTDFLQPIYANIPNKKVITGGLTYAQVEEEVKKHDEVIMCGHGYMGGLFSISNFPGLNHTSYIVDHKMASILKTKKKIVTIWCYAKNYIENNNIKNSLHSGMFISELGEVWCSGHKNITQSMIDDSNSCFSEELGSLIALDPQEIYEAMQHGKYAKLAQTNLIAAYNFERLHYDALLNINAI
jgi:hypothetical protein